MPPRSLRCLLVAAVAAVPLLLAGPASAATSTETAWATAVRTVLNSERHDHNLPALAADSRLVASARAHNLAMAKANTLSHQCKGEAGLGTRETKAGYHWKAAAENIGWTGTETQTAVVGLQRQMYHEKPPNDGHRRNMLSTAYHDVGVDVYVDSTHHKVWLTIDFGHR